MFRAARVLCAQATKKSTGLTGLAVVPNAREVLIKLYEKTLRDVAIIPAGVPYREAVEAFTTFRMAVVKENENIPEIERVIGCGQVEELIEQAKGELILIPEFANWKMWEKKPPTPDDDNFSDVYEDLTFINPDSVAYLGLKDLAVKKRAEAAAHVTHDDGFDMYSSRAADNIENERRRSEKAAAAAAATAAAAAAKSGPPPPKQ